MFRDVQRIYGMRAIPRKETESDPNRFKRPRAGYKPSEHVPGPHKNDRSVQRHDRLCCNYSGLLWVNLYGPTPHLLSASLLSSGRSASCISHDLEWTRLAQCHRRSNGRCRTYCVRNRADYCSDCGIDLWRGSEPLVVMP